MSNKKFLAIWIPILTLILIISIAGNLIATTFSSVFIRLFSWERGVTEVVNAEGTEDWDANYYSFTAKNLAEATSNAAKTTENICDEGFVLLKNNGALPLNKTTDKIALLGRGSADVIYGGSGSGNTDGAPSVATAKDAMVSAGFTVNEDVSNFFNSQKSKYDKCAIKMDDYQGSTFFIGEIPTSKYTFTPVSTETAVVFISRGGGEGWDLSTDLITASKTTASQAKINSNANTAAEVANYVAGQHQLELCKEEKDMVAYANANYANTVVVINSSNVMELGDLQKDTGVDAILWIGSPGAAGINAMGRILSGEVNPSGRTVDIYPYDFTKDPSFNNIGMNQYMGLTASDVAKGTANNNAYTMQYEEGIYVGYRYYETAAAEAMENNYAGFNYQDAVVYPFGYGLSYSTFTTEFDGEPTLSNGTYTFKVKVTNNGDYAGKYTAQIYAEVPYTDGGIEKAKVVLVGFDKTSLLAKNASEVLTIKIDQEDLASYDYKTEKSYVLDQGKYTFYLSDNSHSWADSDTEKWETNLSKRVFTDGRASDAQTATNQFDDVSTMFRDTATTGYALNFSRSSFATTFPTAPTEDDLSSSIVVAKQQNGGTTVKAGLAKFDVNTDPTLGNVETSKVYSSTAPVKGANNGASLIDLRGIDYEDSAWDALLDNLVSEDFVDKTLNWAAYNTQAIESINKPKTYDPDGPAGLSSLFSATGCNAFMSEVVLASTFSTDLAEEMGTALGEEAYYYQKAEGGSVGGTNGWYAPAMNIHRSPFAGRNFEYYSEDGFLGGQMGAGVVRGASSKGIVCYIKHFALNDSEVYRTNNLCVWANEQAIREIYLKPFEDTIKESDITLKYLDVTSDAEGKAVATLKEKTIKGAVGLMSSFNRLGTTWAGGHYGLMTEVLRNEWNFNGVAISDFNLYEYMDADQGMRAGTDMQLAMGEFGMGKKFSDLTSNTALTSMRKSIKNMSYAVSNSNIMQGVTPGSMFIYHLAPWQITFITLAVIMYVAVAGGVVWVVFRTYKKKNEKNNIETK